MGINRPDDETLTYQALSFTEHRRKAGLGFRSRGGRIYCMISRCLIVALVLTSVATIHADVVWVIRQDGVGPAKIGMTLPQLNAVLGETFAKPSEKGSEGEGGDACFYVNPAKHPHVSFMIEHGRLYPG